MIVLDLKPQHFYIFRERVRSNKSSKILTVQEFKEVVDTGMEEPDDTDTPYIMEAALEVKIVFCTFLHQKLSSLLFLPQN